jgi:hypothetical protein
MASLSRRAIETHEAHAPRSNPEDQPLPANLDDIEATIAHERIASAREGWPNEMADLAAQLLGEVLRLRAAERDRLNLRRRSGDGVCVRIDESLRGRRS